MKLQYLIASAFLALLPMTTSVAGADKVNFVATDEIQAEDFSYAYESQMGSGAQLYCSEPQTVYVGYNIVGAYLLYQGMDFGKGVTMLTMRMSSWINETQVGFINLQVDNMNMLPFARFPIRTTSPNDYCHFVVINEFLQGYMSGVHDLYLTFSQPSSKPFVNIDWLRFNSTA